MIERAQTEIRQMGATIREQTLFVSAVAQTLVRAPEYGYGGKALEDYLSRLPAEIRLEIELQLRVAMSMASATSGNTEEAGRQAEMAMTAAIETASHDERSDASFLLAVSRIKRATAPRNKSMAMVALSNASITLQLWASIDQFMGHPIQAADKFAWLASVELQICNTHNIVLEKVCEMEILRATRLQDYDTPVRISRERLDAGKERSGSSHFHKAQHTTQLLSCLYTQFRARAQSMAQLPPDQSETVAKDYFESIMQANEPYSLCTQAGGSETIITSLNYLFDLLSAFQFNSQVELLKSWLVEAQKIENFYDAIRRTVAMASNYRKLYDNAFTACKITDDVAVARQWVQKSKARSLSDIFGIRAVLQLSLLATIKADSEAHALFEKERLLRAAALKTRPLEYLNARRQAEEVRLRMKEHPLRAQALTIRAGAFDISFSQAALGEALALSGGTCKNVKYVEWYIPHQPSSETKIVLLVRALDGDTNMRELNITTGSIEF
ncbi:uncharacterized protein Z519_08405 [Cladophialophora bantiana CBS 173.52]|uniref:Uncharacterized protein n=1 Tax=Cladophialophora bantiana (strain ATCC 10958 / CBS 173.52 / CDC B-1940 / NIH 8579) TaxID=1442370 RepID=A0A0D2FVP6_CLAB1|nr:uncharacterized protein Z519_08405 [Cladophialophora bantiana CBS 173.52]KIW90622.1 hypothetical protein Z519_08405 [Cladophialophora bantiana CBS 173.52]